MDPLSSLSLNLAAVGIYRALASVSREIGSTDWADVGGLDCHAAGVWRSGLDWLERAEAAAESSNWVEAFAFVDTAIIRLSGMVDLSDREALCAIREALEGMPEDDVAAPSTAREMFQVALVSP